MKTSHEVNGGERGRGTRGNHVMALVCTGVIVATILGSGEARGGLVIVPDHFAAINEALSAIGEFDTVLVRPGTFVEDVGMGLGYHPNSYRLLSESGPEVTVILGLFRSGISELPIDLVIKGFTFSGSRGIHIDASGASRIVVADCIVERSSSGGSGLAGGINILAGSPFSEPWVVVDDGVVRENEGERGGGIFLYSGGLIRGSVITGNVATEGGGGIYVAQGGRTEIQRCTIADNRVDVVGAGAGVEVHGMQSWHRLTVSRAILAGNVGGYGIHSDLQAVPVVNCVDSWDNEAGNYFGFPDPTGGNGNISVDPAFCLPGEGDYRLQVTSPCAPGNSPPGCDLIGALPVGCGGASVDEQGSPGAEVILMVLPNPASGVVEFRTRGGRVGGVVEIYSSRGAVVEVLGSGADRIRWVPGVEVSTGVYFARVLAGGRPAVAKFVFMR